MRNFLFLCLLSFFIQPILASTHKPQACPSIPAIQSLGVKKIQTKDGLWVATNTSQYHTANNWFFYIFVSGNSNDKSKLLKKGNETIKLLSTVSGPARENQTHIWTCMYNGGGYLAFAEADKT